MSNLEIFKKVFLLFIGWRLALIVLIFYISGILPVQDRINNTFFPPTTSNYWMHWAQWDSAHILAVVESGYILNRTPFFPLYPLLIKLCEFIGVNAFWGGFAIAQIAAFAAVFYLYKLVLLDFGKVIAEKAVFLLLVFPTSFYLGAIYSEPLFLALSVAAFYSARKKKWLLAGILAGLTVATRLIGVAVIISIFVEFFFTRVPQFKIEFIYNTFLKRISLLLLFLKLTLDFLIRLKAFGYGITAGVAASMSGYCEIPLWTFLIIVSLFYLLKYVDFKKLYSWNFLYLLLSLLPIGLYMYYLYITFGEPFGFLKGHENWGRHLTTPFSTVTNHLRLMMPNFIDKGIRNQLQLELAAFVLLSIFFVLGLRRLRISYVVYFGVSLLFPLLSGKLMSMPRIALVVFPMFILLAQIKNAYVQKLWIMVSLLLLSALTILYTNNYWVA